MKKTSDNPARQWWQVWEEAAKEAFNTIRNYCKTIPAAFCEDCALREWCNNFSGPPEEWKFPTDEEATEA